jgi:hypothetical protein
VAATPAPPHVTTAHRPRQPHQRRVCKPVTSLTRPRLPPDGRGESGGAGWAVVRSVVCECVPRSAACLLLRGFRTYHGADIARVLAEGGTQGRAEDARPFCLQPPPLAFVDRGPQQARKRECMVRARQASLSRTAPSPGRPCPTPHIPIHSRRAHRRRTATRTPAPWTSQSGRRCCATCAASGPTSCWWPSPAGAGGTRRRPPCATGTCGDPWCVGVAWGWRGRPEKTPQEKQAPPPPHPPALAHALSHTPPPPLPLRSP